MSIFSRFKLCQFAVALSFLPCVAQASAVLNISTSNPNTTGVYNITWSGARQYIDLYEGSTRVVAAAPPVGSYAVSGKASGTYTYTLYDCASYTTCIQTTLTVVVARPASSSSSSSATVSSSAVFQAASSAGKSISVSYEYDSLGRLSNVKENNQQKTNYKYDTAGNRTSVSE